MPKHTVTTLLQHASLSNKHQTPNTLNRAIITTLFSSYNNPTSTSVMQIATVVSLGPKTNRKKYNSQVQGAALLHFYKVAV
jgi:hypothetical protein